MRAQSPMLSPMTVRRAIAIFSSICVAGMIVSAALKHLGGVITFGCLSSAGIVMLMAVIATQSSEGPESNQMGLSNPEQAVLVESLAVAAMTEGANEQTVRSLVGAAVTLGKSFRKTS